MTDERNERKRGQFRLGDTVEILIGSEEEAKKLYDAWEEEGFVGGDNEWWWNSGRAKYKGKQFKVKANFNTSFPCFKGWISVDNAADISWHPSWLKLVRQAGDKEDYTKPDARLTKTFRVTEDITVESLTKVDVKTSSAIPSLTPDEAREFASKLVEAADYADYIKGATSNVLAAYDRLTKSDGEPTG